MHTDKQSCIVLVSKRLPLLPLSLAHSLYSMQCNAIHSILLHTKFSQIHRAPELMDRLISFAVFYVFYAYNFCLRIENECSIFATIGSVLALFLLFIVRIAVVLNKLISRPERCSYKWNCRNGNVMNKAMHLFFNTKFEFHLLTDFPEIFTLTVVAIAISIAAAFVATTTNSSSSIITFDEQNFQHFSHSFYCNREFMQRNVDCRHRCAAHPIAIKFYVFLYIKDQY